MNASMNAVWNPLLASGRGRLLSPQDRVLSVPPGSPQAKALASAKEFESVFLHTMIEQMLAGLGKEGPLGEGEAGGAWRGLLVQEYAGTIAKSGGIGIADSVYHDILALQERTRP
jgi:Rod binding domain-containing protein